MGKRKSSRKPVKKLKTTLDKEFSCLFCNHERTVTAKLDNEHKIGQLTCSACGVSFQTTITTLSEPIDLYSDWIDACEQANDTSKPAAATGGSHGGARSGASAPAAGGARHDEYDDSDDE
ncbi:transcription elongation factor Elf1 like-domain-containing protein [Entophlyctis helioformis]|nr:transcription elongation factor Elf1 like-domain-containing protein [Entophlyctis helioformis]